MTFAAVVLAVLSLWDYPARQPEHERLSAEMAEAVRAGDHRRQYAIARRATAAFPEDPEWRYRQAAAIAHSGNEQDQSEALDTLEKAIDLGMRDSARIAGDDAFSSIRDRARLKELVKYAEDSQDRAIWSGPLASVPQTGTAGDPVMIGAHNLRWNFEYGLFEVLLKLDAGKGGGNEFDLYLNRDGFHSSIDTASVPGLTKVLLDKEGRRRRFDRDLPNMLFPYPVFANSSQALTEGPYFRSIPRALMSTEAHRLRGIEKLYLSNQIWVFPSAPDFPPVGTNGDCFASMAPYWLISQGRSWSDKYYLGYALEVSRKLKPETKAAAVKAGLLAPTVYSLMHRALKSVTNETEYLSAAAFPSALPPNGLDARRLGELAAAMSPEAVPPVVRLLVTVVKPQGEAPEYPECTYLAHHAVAFVLRSPQPERVFFIKGAGAHAYEFRLLHGDREAVKIEPFDGNAAKVTLRKPLIRERVDIGVFGKSAVSGFGMPSFVSFTTLERDDGGYVDPYLKGTKP